MYCFVILCIALYSSILLFVVLGKLAGYDSVGGRGITNHMGAPEWCNQKVLNSIVHESVAAEGSTNDMAALSCPIERT